MNLKYHCNLIKTASGQANNTLATIALLALAISLLSSSARADNQLRLASISKHSVVFTFNNKQATAIPKRKTNAPRFFNSDQFSLETQLAVSNDPHLEFNYLWMRQNQDNYRYSDGSAAIGKLLRMRMKTWYKSYRASNKNIGLPNENGGGSIGYDVDYRVRLSSNRIKLALEYEF